MAMFKWQEEGADLSAELPEPGSELEASDLLSDYIRSKVANNVGRLAAPTRNVTDRLYFDIEHPDHPDTSFTVDMAAHLMSNEGAETDDVTVGIHSRPPTGGQFATSYHTMNSVVVIRSGINAPPPQNPFTRPETLPQIIRANYEFERLIIDPREIESLTDFIENGQEIPPLQPRRP